MVRQLENLIQRAVAIGETEYVVRGDIPEDFFSANATEGNSKARRFYDALDETDREVCIRAFTASEGTAPLPHNCWDSTEIPCTG